jgi:hypothetical protein
MRAMPFGQPPLPREAATGTHAREVGGAMHGANTAWVPVVAFGIAFLMLVMIELISISRTPGGHLTTISYAAGDAFPNRAIVTVSLTWYGYFRGTQIALEHWTVSEHAIASGGLVAITALFDATAQTFLVLLLGITSLEQNSLHKICTVLFILFYWVYMVLDVVVHNADTTNMLAKHTRKGLTVVHAGVAAIFIGAYLGEDLATVRLTEWCLAMVVLLHGLLGTYYVTLLTIPLYMKTACGATALPTYRTAVAAFIRSRGPFR